jgi:hypothetical protein
MAYAPSTRFTAYDILSMARYLAKADDVSNVMIHQGKYFYELALTEIVTLLNGALEPSYLSSVEAVDKHADDSYVMTEDQLTVENDFFYGSEMYGTTNTFVRCINLLQKRVYTDDGSILTIHDPLNGKQIDKIIAIEPKVIGAGAEFTAYINAPGQIKQVKLEQFQSMLRLDFSSGASKDDLVYMVIGGNKSEASPVSDEGEWVASDSEYLPTAGTIATDLFDSVFIRIRKDKNNNQLTIVPNYLEGGASYRRIHYNIWYQRMPNFPVSGTSPSTDGWMSDSTHPSRFVDLPDKHIPLLAKKIYIYCLLQLSKSIPDQLSYDVNREYQAISGNMDAELKNQMYSSTINQGKQ